MELFCPISHESNHTTFKQQFLKLAWQDVGRKQFIAYLDGEKKEEVSIIVSGMGLFGDHDN